MTTIRPILFAIAVSAFAQAPQPKLSISVNGRRNPEVRKGAPVLVRAVLMHSGRLSRTANVPELQLAPNGAGWPDAIRLRVSDRLGGEVPWSHSLVVVPEQPALVLPYRAWVALEWILSETEAALLAPGDYQIQAVLEVRDSQGWNGEVVSPPAILRIIDSTTPSEAQQASEVLLRSVLALRTGAMSEAVQELDELLRKQPESVRALQLRAELAESAGDVHLALIFANRALTAARKTYTDPGKQLLSLVLLRDRLYWRLLDSVAPTPTP
ncbi:MAG: hypothetical protein HYZ57_07380 [Acidobacteria bacterium]|nr:hypothetical protein [Acidobacteriota bacterium]MBI3279645.1 hypothetical protein [Acidobacteriota bacterium]